MTLAELDPPRVSPARRRTEVGTALSLFSGAGGLDLGLEAAGWRLLSQVECDADCVGTLGIHNAKRGEEVAVYDSRLENLSPRTIRRALGIAKGELTVMAGGPPCQPFTTSGLRKGLLDARASSAFPAYLAFVEEFLPAAVLVENVDGMLSAALRHRPLVERTAEHSPLGIDERKGSFLRWLVGELASLGYAVSWGVVEAADHGVPQLRQRAILMGVRGDEPCFLPDPLFGRVGLPDYRTLREALRDVTETGPVQPLSERKRDVYRQIPAGGNWRDLPDEIQRATMGAAYHAEGGKSGWWRRLSWDSPAPTILGMPDHSSTALVHPDEVRCLSVNECAAIQTFPRGAQFAGTPRSQYQQIGNAVPPTLGHRLGDTIARFLEGERRPVPDAPAWRQISANRRIGTHGWAKPTRTGFEATLSAAIRPDHVWHFLEDPEHGVGQDRARRGGKAA